uniref:Dynein light chain roadblock n=1 Tax=Chaetoceros debilis TaxID=122233 RepID=A0A7S3V519_9STRA|mmetsp:Transcript_22946/g.34976  ORF Transcript_22946/g.34976 Transcript_22946/m.34976 type:complete len:116 (-) Transcript_22946:1141-1488(-)
MMASTSTTAATATAASISNDVEETLARIRSHKGVEGVLILTKEGAIVHTSLTEKQSKAHAALVSQLTSKASILVESLDPDDELSFLRIRSQKKEIMVAPDKDFLMLVIQNPDAVD